MEQVLSLFTRLVVALETIAGSYSKAPATSTAATTSTGTTTTKTAAEKKAEKAAADAAAKSVPTAEAASASLTSLREYIDANGEKGLDYCRTIMNDVAGVKKMAEIPEDKRAAVIAAAEVALAEFKAKQEAAAATEEM